MLKKSKLKQRSRRTENSEATIGESADEIDLIFPRSE